MYNKKRFKGNIFRIEQKGQPKFMLYNTYFQIKIEESRLRFSNQALCFLYFLMIDRKANAINT